MYNDRRIRVLPQSEIDDLFTKPNFTEEERIIWFELNKDEYEFLNFSGSLARKVDLVIQLGYFKCTHRFFKFTLDAVKDDIDYVMNLYFPEKVLKKSTLGREAKSLNQSTVLKEFGFVCFDNQKHIPLLLEKAQTLSRISNDPIFLFRGLFDFLKDSKITIPGYTTFQEQIISVALRRENERIYSCLSSNMSHIERESLLALLEESDQFYAITCLKKNPKNFRLNAIKIEVGHHEQLLPLYQISLRVLPLLNFSKTAINYYASLVDHYTVQGLNRIHENQTCLWLLCFVYKRYKLMLDNITTMLIYTANQYTEAVKEKAKELLVADLLKPNNQNAKIAKTLKFFYDPNVNDKKEFFDIKKDVHRFFPTEQIIEAVEILERQTKKYENQFHWLAVDELSRTYKQPLRLLIKIITLNGNQHKALTQAHQFLKEGLIQNIALSQINFSKFPIQFIRPADEDFIYKGTILNTNRYEYECYHRIALAINESALYVTDSIRYSNLTDELLPDWQNKKNSVIKKLNNRFFNRSINDFIEEHVKPLDKKIESLNEDINSGKNEHIKVKENKDGERFGTLPYTRKNAEIKNPFYEELPNISITNLLHVVDEKTGFINDFTHIKPYYSKSKRDEISIFVTLVANGTNLGISKMESLCDLNFNDLNCADKNFIRLSTLRAANDRISNAIAKLGIFKHWNMLSDLLLASADGQKMSTERENLMARHSLKYFGLEKGVVAYSLIANHVPINAVLIGANMHESHFLFDLFYNNTSQIKPDILSTDTEGVNHINYLFLNVIDKLFAPRYRSLSAKTQSIISFEDPSYFSDYLIKPNRAFNTKLVLDEGDNVQHIIASLLSGEAIKDLSMVEL
ncbi:MAG: Tn3 family transposase [Alphaproteobacteria bacterium]|nr:Tn3 family transposase [Alphaproteobacteria bacterium]